MAEKREPPLSVRLPEGMRARVDEWAKRHGKPTNAAVVALLERGLSTTDGEWAIRTAGLRRGGDLAKRDVKPDPRVKPRPKQK